ncbi:MAG: hypothetical protein F2830_01080 [Actinobacteria bacterium]|nr:hypothetical protein [Actinomycetota bacterium]MSW62235.1 hypothetical protein [Actinomycetota bacterium]MSX89314.1 hypothetical protein [Actinomycetota bacterium]MSZ64113.1 hypothetical protein [Actinomycetota bacterium]MTA58434.1 hypothetical protein [Actinomycetota bacterium]
MTTQRSKSRDLAMYPRLKNGVYITRPSQLEEKSIYVATSTHAIEIVHTGARAIICQLNGLQTPDEISSKLFAPRDLVDNVIDELKDANFIDTVKNKITLHNRFQSAIPSRASHTSDQSLDAAFSQLQKRLVPELSQATWLSGVKDGGVEVLSNRQNFGVEIFGSSRTATLLCSILLASGVTNTRIALTSMQEHSSISDKDLGSGTFRTSDIGLNFRSRLEELSREWSLFPVASHPSSMGKNSTELIPERNLRIIVGGYENQWVEHFTRDHHDHLFVGKIAGGVATCGPLVKPGYTPCMQCLQLGNQERYGSFHNQLTATQATSDEIPIATVHQLAAISAHAVLRYIDTASSPLLGAQIHLEYLEPFTPRLIRFSRHPHCTCMWQQQNA